MNLIIDNGTIPVKAAYLVTSLLLGMVADLVLYYVSLGSGISPANAHLIGFLAGVLPLLFIGVVFLREHAGRIRLLPTVSLYLLIEVFALFLRGGVFALFMQIVHCTPQIAILPAAAVSAAVVLIGIRLTILGREADRSGSFIRHTPLTIAVIAYAVLVRFLCSALVELIFEEAYYWNYAQHLDIGYLDHPPMVGWLIWVFTTLLADTECAVRAGSCLCWSIAAYYSYQLAVSLFDKAVALKVLLLVTVLPVFFGFGLVMLPDAPLLACWAGALYYLYRLLIEEKRAAWLGAGIFMGMGLLSKYTICLLGLGAFSFILVNGQYRKWLRRPEPYLSILLAILLFSPVIIWNARHAWVSFLFQSTGRINALLDFDLPDLVGIILFILTPTGAMAVLAIIGGRSAMLDDMPGEHSKNACGFLLTTTMLPVTIFFFISLFRSVKVVWTAPLWLGMLPYIAAFTMPGHRKLAGSVASLARRAWPGTIAVVLVIYGAMLHYSALGFPGVPYPQFVPSLGMEHLAVQIEGIVDAFQRNTNEKPLVVCMEENKIGSLLVFYRAKLDAASGGGNKTDIVSNTTGGHFFGGKSLMYAYWHPLEMHKGKVILLIGHKADQLDRKRVQFRTDPIGGIREIVVLKNGRMAGRYYYRFLKENTA